MGLTNLGPGGVGAQGSTSASAGGEAVSQTVPAYASWFELGKVHDIERGALPEFFSGDDGGRAYVSWRDHMVGAYRARPHEYLSLTAVRRALGGDVCGLLRVHAFLEQWGLINYQVAGGTGASASVGIVPGTVATGRRPVVASAAAAETPAAVVVAAASAASAVGGGAHPIEAFLRMDTAEKEGGEAAVPWTEEETLALLRAVEESGEDVPDWDDVAHRVGRPRDQCVLRFLALPTDEAVAVSAHSGEALGDTLSLPFAAGENPVMATLAFLAGAVHPRVAAAAARAAVAEVAVHMRAASHAADAMVDGGGSDDEIAPEGRPLAQVAAAALACAAARASELAADEARRGAQLRAALLDLHMARLRAKLALYEDLERTLEDDRRDLEQQRLALFFERFNLRKQMLALDGDGAAGPLTAL